MEEIEIRNAYYPRNVRMDLTETRTKPDIRALGSSLYRESLSPVAQLCAWLHELQ